MLRPMDDVAPPLEDSEQPPNTMLAVPAAANAKKSLRSMGTVPPLAWAGIYHWVNLQAKSM